MPPPYPARQIGRLYRRDDRNLEEKYGLFVGPYFYIEISGNDDRILFSAESQPNEGNYDLNGLIISDVEWEENDCQASMMTITVQNYDLTLHDSRLFAEGNSIDLWMGYDGRQPDYMGRAIIVEIAPEFPADAIPTLQITAYDISHFLMEEGKAEIQSEGTSWWERHRVNQPPVNATGAQTRLGGYRDTQAQRQADAREASRVGFTEEEISRGIPSRVVDELGESGNLDQTAIRPFRTEGGTNTNVPRSRTQLRRVRVPRRRRNRGKVWRNLRDDEIAAKIFESYGIIPYTEAINQRARARTEIREVNRPGEFTLDNILDTDAQVQDAHDAQRARGGPLITPPVSIDRGGASLRAHTRPIRAVRVEGTDIVRVTVQVGGRRVVQKAGTSDWEFLKMLAKNHGFIVFTFYDYDGHNWIGYWGSPHNVPQYVVYDFHYNNGESTSLKSFKPKISMRGQKTEIDLLYVDPRTRKENRLRVAMENISAYSPEFRGPDATSALDEPLGNGPEVTLTIHGQRVSVHADRRFSSMDDAKQWLMSFWYNHASEFCEAEGNFITGLPEVRCRHKHRMHGFARYDGEYFFTQVMHKMAPQQMYECSFSAFRMADMQFNEPDQETEALTVESEDLGQRTPAANDAVNQWRRAGGS
jgi:hypothetical protein